MAYQAAYDMLLPSAIPQNEKLPKADAALDEWIAQPSTREPPPGFSPEHL